MELLRQQGHLVKGVDLNLYDGCDFFTPPAADESVCGDIMALTPRDFEGVDAVIHLAALSNDPLSEVNPAHSWRTNFEGTVHVAKCAKLAGTGRFLFSSSCSIYGKVGDEVLGEDAELVPITVYGETKVESERALQDLADSDFSPIMLRNATAYGSSPRLRLDIVLNNLAAWAYTTGQIRIISDGTPWRPLVHCRDIARAFLHLLCAPREVVHSEVFNVGRTEENYRVRDIADAVQAVMPEASITYTGEGSPDARDYRVDFSKFEESFPDFKFEHDLHTGAAELLHDYEQHGLTLEDVEGPRYTRLRILRAKGMV